MVSTTPAHRLDQTGFVHANAVGAVCTQSCYGQRVSRVIQIRDVPDDVHQALSEAARAQGVSLTRYMRAELAQLARRAQVVAENADLVRRTQARIGGGVDRETILQAVREGRDG